MKNRIIFILGACALLFAVKLADAGDGDFIWIEGESAVSNTMSRHPWWYDKVKKIELSGGDYISNWNDKKAGEAIYEFNVSQDKEFTFWIRANAVGTKLAWQLDEGELKEVDVNKKEGEINIAEDEKLDVRFIAWINAGDIKLGKGAHKIKFKMHSDNNNHGMLDCFVFAPASWSPNGTMKPGEKTAVIPDAGRWPFEASKDEFSSAALLDLRYLNEKVAGESGFVTRSKDGNVLLLGNGKPARFWALNDGASGNGGVNLDRHARFLAKRGINMVRTGNSITPTGTDLMQADPQEIDHLWHTVASMKKEGIYTTFSPYWAGPSRVKPAAMGTLDAGKNGAWGLLFFDKKLQEAYKSWIKQALTQKNPYTGIPLGEDPALAIIEIQNEDSLLFYTSQGIGGAAAVELRKQFGEWCKKKYGDLDKAKASWQGAGVKEDNFANGEVGLYIVWSLTQRQQNPGEAKRTADQMQFYTETMYNFNKMIGDYIHNELHCKLLVNAGNWRTADNVTMLDAERYSYTPNEVMAVNRYYGGAHEGANCGWAICKGDKFTDESTLYNPRELPVTLKQVEGYPIIITESSWVPPQGYQSEGPFMIAAYQSMNGVSGYYWFASDSEGWRHPASANGFLPSDGKWICATPMLMGQWPATALFYRLGYVKQGEPVVSEQRALPDLWDRKMPLIAEDAGYDPNRDKDNLSKESNIKNGIDPLAYLAGPVVVKYGGDPAQSKVADLSKYIDHATKHVKAVTGELDLDYGNGVCTLNAPKVQGVTGFLNKVGAFKLADVEIKSNDQYATILAVSMDDKELKSSHKILIQIGTTERPTQWQTKPAQVGNKKGEEVVNFGKAPWQIVRTNASLSISNSTLTKGIILDANGMAVKEIPLTDSNGAKQLQIPPDTLYVVLE